ncbi:putative DNA topoisomerase II subunit [Campylobacter phage F348]|uniref:DNA topoisomerase (ATP-hydrolyzing) n=1 Tax=Campylobacter phage F348 TaxID=2794362 RepID=A0A7T3N219_9CAUD|nr:putative DNA topoisomerase II subunit [Campylobacter phage F348]
MTDNKIVYMDNEILYYLNLPHLITGSLTSFNNTVKVLENNKIVNKEIVYNQTLTKQIDEAIQNSIDEFTRTDGKYANKISLKIDKDNGIITISDNGRGLPIDTYVMATTKFRTSSNYTFLEKEKKDRITIGAHGIGSKLIPLFSSEYQLTTITLEGIEVL